MATFAGQLVTGALSGTGVIGPFQPIANKPFNVFITGTFSGTVVVQRSFDGGVNYFTIPKPDLTDASFTGDVNFEVYEPDASVLYQINCTAYVSGTISGRMGS